MPQPRADLLVCALRVAGDSLEVLFELRVVVDLEMVGLVDMPVETVVLDAILAPIGEEVLLRVQLGAAPAGQHRASDCRDQEAPYTSPSHWIAPCYLLQTAASRIAPSYYSANSGAKLRATVSMTVPGPAPRGRYNDVDVRVIGSGISGRAFVLHLYRRIPPRKPGWLRPEMLRRRQPETSWESAGEEGAVLPEEALQHVNSLYGAALRFTRNPADAEDLVPGDLSQGVSIRGALRAGHESQGVAAYDSVQHVPEHPAPGGARGGSSPAAMWSRIPGRRSPGRLPRSNCCCGGRWKATSRLPSMRCPTLSARLSGCATSRNFRIGKSPKFCRWRRGPSCRESHAAAGCSTIVWPGAGLRDAEGMAVMKNCAGR